MPFYTFLYLVRHKYLRKKTSKICFIYIFYVTLPAKYELKRNYME